MNWHFQPSLLSQMRLAWQRIALVAMTMSEALGLGLTGLKPFLPRAERALLALKLGFAEAFLRRLLLLEAASLGPLAPVAGKPARAAAPQATPRRPAGPAAPRPPAFRLFESRPGKRQVPATPPQPFRPGPRLLYLDAPLPPPERGEYPARADDLVPTGRLIPRLHALVHALTHPEPLIRALRRRMACRWRPMLAPALQSATRSRKLERGDRDALRDLHDDATLIDAALDSS